MHHNFTVPLVDQVNQWEQYAADILPNSPDSTLVAWWIGINDTGDTLKNATVRDYFFAALVQIIKVIFNRLPILLNFGHKKWTPILKQWYGFFMCENLRP